MFARIKKALRINPSRIWLEEFIRRAAQSTSKQSLVLDAGAGEGYYQSLFARARYHATDLCKVEKIYPGLHFVSDLAHIPIQDEAYDLIICTQVLEHVPQPEVVLGEFFRVLKPSGQLWFSAPFFFPEHEVPYDFYRYTRYGLQFLLESRGFQIQELDWLDGYFASLGFQMRMAARLLSLSPAPYGNRLLALLLLPIFFFLKGLFYVLSLFFYFLEIRLKNNGRGFGKNIRGIAIKPACENLTVAGTPENLN